MLRRLLKFLLVFGVTVLVLGLGIYFLARRQVMADREVQREALAAGFEAYHATFEEDQRLAAALPVFAMTHGEGDAGPFLNPRLAWDENHPEVKAWRASFTEPPKSLQLPKALRDQLTEGSWATLPGAAHAEIDFGWMARLKGFDHWDLETKSPLTDTNTFAFYDAPVPAFIDLLPWARLRLIQGIASGEVALAAEEVRHLARLLLSTEVLLGEMVGQAVLKIEDEARLHLVEAGAELPEGWVTLESEQAPRLRRTLWASIAYTHLDAPGIWSEAAAKIEVGLCAGLQETGWAAVMARPLLGDTREEDFEHFEALLEGSRDRCRLGRLRTAWAAGADGKALTALCGGPGPIEGAAAEICELAEMAGWIPGVRPLIGELFFSVANPDWWRDYREAETES